MDRRDHDPDSPFYERSDYPSSFRDLNHRHRNAGPDKDVWRKSVDSFLDEYRGGRDRSPHDRSRGREEMMERDRDRDRRRGSPRDRRESNRDYRNSPRDDIGRYNRRGNPRDGFRDEEDERMWMRKEKYYRQDERFGNYKDDFHDPRDELRDDYYNRGRKWNDNKDRVWLHDNPLDENELRKRNWVGKVWATSDDNFDNYDDWMEGDLDSLKGDFNNVESERISLPKIDPPSPNKTVIIRGMAQHITENDIRQDIAKCHLIPKDIRLIRRKDTGTSRGFAFVEFTTTEEAVEWMERNNGELMLKDQYRAILQYSLRKDQQKERMQGDWHCKCNAHNFKRRDMCYKCGVSRQAGEQFESFDALEEVSPHPTNTVLLRGLAVITTEENVLKSIQTLSSLPIRSIRIGRFPTTSVSRGVCYLEMNSVMDAMYLHNALLMAKPVVDGKEAKVSYCKLDPPTISSLAMVGSAALAGNAAIAAAQWSHQKTGENQYTLDDVSRLAEYSADLYATTPEERANYLTYYTQYYTKKITQGEQISLPANSTTTSAGAQSTSKSQTETSQSEQTKTPLTQAPDGSGDRTYPIPDVSSYQYDKSSGYYYDPYTTLYYDAQSQYYYNPKTTKFVYWDSTKHTFLPAPAAQAQETEGTGPALDPPSAASAPTQNDSTQKEEDDKKTKEKSEKPEKSNDKVKVAKRIAKDMERWAKTLNHKKEIAKQNLIASAATPTLKTQGAADIGFAVLERKDLVLPSGMGVTPLLSAPQILDNSLVANYGQGSESEEEPEDAQSEEKLHTDWNKIACLLCKRQFPSKDALTKHNQLSDLHKQNLDAWYKSKGLDPNSAQNRIAQYRDRAKERRLKYGEPDQPQPNRLKETYMKARDATVTYEEPTKAGIGSDNRGNKLLQKMGWQEGMGLGKKNQGRTNIIQAETRSASAGLGTKSQGVVPGPGETYKDCVKKMMYIRYKELEENS